MVFLLPFTHSSFTETQTPDSWRGRSITAHQSNLCTVLDSSNHQHELTSLSSIKHHVVHHTYRSRNVCVRPIRLRVCNGNGHNIIMSGYFLWLRAYKVLAFYSTIHDEWKCLFLCLSSITTSHLFVFKPWLSYLLNPTSTYILFMLYKINNAQNPKSFL